MLGLGLTDGEVLSDGDNGLGDIDMLLLGEGEAALIEGDGLNEIEADGDAALIEGDGLNEIEADGLAALIETDGLTLIEADGLAALIEGDGLIDADADGEAALAEVDGLGLMLIDADGENALGGSLKLGDGLILPDGDIDGDIDGDRLGDMLALGENVLTDSDGLNDGLGLKLADGLNGLIDGIVLAVVPRRIMPISPFCCMLTIWPILTRSSSTDIVLPPWIIY
jgi:hypothetical protein